MIAYRKHYKVVVLKLDDITEDKIENELEKYASQGWELISFDWEAHSYPVCVFKDIEERDER